MERKWKGKKAHGKQMQRKCKANGKQMERKQKGHGGEMGGNGEELERKWKAIGEQIERKWKANGKEVERKWKGNGKEMDRKWKAIAKQIERKWKGNGQEMESNLKGDGKEARRRPQITDDLKAPRLEGKPMFEAPLQRIALLQARKPTCIEKRRVPGLHGADGMHQHPCMHQREAMPISCETNIWATMRQCRSRDSDLAPTLCPTRLPKGNQRSL